LAVSFTVPDELIQGSYLFMIKVDNKGFFGGFEASIEYLVSGVISGSTSFGGGILTIQGSGLKLTS
jgi:hypothetical protein